MPQTHKTMLIAVSEEPGYNKFNPVDAGSITPDSASYECLWLLATMVSKLKSEYMPHLFTLN